MVYLFYNIKKDFIVKVVDKIPPDIELKGDNPAYVCPNKDYIEEGYTALDNYDGDITDKVDTIIGKDNILYNTKANLEKGEFYVFYENKNTLEEISALIKFVKGKNIDIVNINKLLE